MNKDIFEGKWKQLKGNIREKWGNLTDDDVEKIAGKYENLLGRIQERYGINKEKAQKMIDDWEA
ncbi:MAG: CsbD family protein [Dehalococcoidales bacterium]|nr:CsbD family protein [Dehalococcoidales bacterium]